MNFHLKNSQWQKTFKGATLTPEFNDLTGKPTARKSCEWALPRAASDWNVPSAIEIDAYSLAPDSSGHHPHLAMLRYSVSCTRVPPANGWCPSWLNTAGKVIQAGGATGVAAAAGATPAPTEQGFAAEVKADAVSPALAAAGAIIQTVCSIFGIQSLDKVRKQGLELAVHLGTAPPAGNPEIVYLSNCEANGQKSSEMDYYPNTTQSQNQQPPAASTQVALKQTVIWEGRGVVGTFQDGNHFTSRIITHDGPFGGIAGTGFNDFHSFNCRKDTGRVLYRQSGKTCTSIYYCQP
jgi:hypothetical protein